MEEKSIERRACIRFKIPGATINYQKESFLFKSVSFIEEFCPIIDLSRGGVRFLTQKSLKENSKVFLKISVPGERIPLTLKGVVKWVLPSEGKSYQYQVGVQFNPYGEEKDQNYPGNLVKIIALEQKFGEEKEEAEPSGKDKDEFEI